MNKVQIVSQWFALVITLSVVATACGADDEIPGPPAREFVVRVVGTLAGPDIVTAQATHDQIAAGGEAEARAAGDFGHDALLGTTMLGTIENEFLGLDRWSDADSMASFYSNPDLASGFAALFAAPPTIEQFEWQADWHGWGDLSSGDDGDAYHLVMVRGRLAAAGDQAQRAHDDIAAGGEAASKAAGDVAHVVFLALDDPREFLAFDIWSDAGNLEGFYSDPQFQAAFGALFEGAPTVSVYRSTDWHQW